MKTHSTRFSNTLLALAGSVLLTTQMAQAAILYWDGATPAGAPGGGAGNWDTTLTNWDNTQTADSSTIWVNANLDTAVFGGTAGTVTLGASIDVGGLTFNTTGYGITTTGFSLNFAAANNTILFNGIAAASITGPVGGSGNVILTASNPATAGTLTLNNSGNGWSGTTTVNAGMTLSLANTSNALVNTSAIVLNGGTITINKNGTVGSQVSDTAGLTFNSGGTFQLTNTTGGAHVETIGAVTVASGQANIGFTNGASSGGVVLTLSGFSRTANTSAAAFYNANAAQTAIRVTGATDTTAGQIIGPWATIGTSAAAQTDYAIYSGGNGTVAAANIAANNTESTWGSAANITLTATSTTLTGTRTLNSLRYNAAAGALDLGASNYNLETYGILNGGTGLLTISSAGTGSLTTASGGGNLFLTTGTGAITVSAPITDNGGAVTLVKSGTGGILTLSGNNTFSGGIVLNAGTLLLTGTQSFTGGVILNGGAVGDNSANALTAAALNNNTITVNGNATINALSGAIFTSSSTITLNGGSSLGITNNNGATTWNGAVTGAGKLVLPALGGGGNTLNLNSTGNNFTGGVDYTNVNNGVTTLNVNSFADSATPGAGNIRFGLGGGTGTHSFNLGSGAIAPLTINNRQFELTGSTAYSAAINNNSSQAFTINSNLLASGTGTRTLTLGGSGRGTFAGTITNGSLTTLNLTQSGSGTWAVSGTNTYSGATRLAANNGTLIFQNADDSLPSTTTLDFDINNNQNGTIRLLSDTSGTLNYGNGIRTVAGGSSGTGTFTIFVGNNGAANLGNGVGGTTGSTIVLGTLDFRSSAELAGLVDSRMASRFNITGANGYNLQVGDVILQGIGTASANGAFLNPTSASLTITGTVKQANGRTALSVAANQKLTLDGTSTGNLISGAIKNATDFDDSSNVNAAAMALVKSNSSTWTLSGINTYTGTTTISGGKLLFTGDSSAATGNVSVTGGALGGNGGSLGGAVTVSSTGGINLSDGSVGSLTLGSTLNITGAAAANNLTFDLGNTTGTSDSLVVAGATTVTTAGAAVINLNQLGGSAGRTATTYTLIGGAGTLAGADFAKFSLATTAAFGQTYALTNTGDDLQLVATNVTSATPAAFWAGGGNNWSTTTNWRDTLAGGGAVAGAPDYQTNVTFSTTTPTPANLTTNVLDVDFNINSLTFTNASGNVTIGGTTRMLTIEAAAVNGNTLGNGIDSQKTSGTNTISAKVGLASSQTWTVATGGTLAVSGAISDFGAGYALTKAGGGTLNLTGATSYTGGTSITGGVLSVNATSVGAINNGPLTLSNGGRLTIGSVNPSSTSQVSVGTGGGLISVSGNNSFTTTGKLTGSGTLTLVDPGGAGGKTFNFNSLENNFTGGIIVSGAAGIALNINSLADSANNIAFTAASGAATISYGSGAIAPLSLSTRAIEINSAGALTGTIQNNNTTHAISIGGNLVATGAGTKILGLGAVAGPSNVYSGTITNGTGGTIGVTKTGAGNWSLTNSSNTFTGVITVNDGTLSYASAGGANSITFSNTTGAATLTYTGSGQTMSGLITASTVTSGTVNLVASGSGAINYSNTGSLGTAGSGIKNLVLSGNNTGANTLAGAWVNNTGAAATLTKDGTGRWVLSGTNTYTGVTNVNAGTLLVNGSIATSSLTTVASGATIGGSGTIGALTVSSGGFINPGNSPDVLDVVGAFTQAGTYNAEITANTVGNGTTGYDQINVTGAVNITGGSLEELFSGTGYAANNLLFILLNDDVDAITGTYAGLLQGAIVTSYDGFDWQISYTADSVGNTFTGGNDIALMAVVPIPEPKTALLGVLGVLLLLRRRRN